ncbi:MAG: glycosyltransferase, partial [Acidobacteria bacterium]|nr:glycosyltransferase [Acidobacteriota bacterium]
LKYLGDWRYRVRFAFGRLADAVVANSAGGYDYWSPARDGGSLRVIQNALPLDEIAESDAALVSGLAFGPEVKVVLCAGRIDLGKNVETLIAALARIADEVPFVAVVCGDGSRRRHVERMAHDLGVAHRVVFTGFVDNLWDMMKRADAFVSLSRFEGCPNVVLEAMACGCPLVVSDIPAHRELLDERSALFADPEDPDEAAAALKATLLCGDAARRRARSARVRVTGKTVKAAARLYEQLYLSLLGEPCDATSHEESISDSEAA